VCTSNAYQLVTFHYERNHMLCRIEANYIPPHLYDILVINTHFTLALASCNNKDIILMLGYN